ncbi:MAG: hypothetical protein ACYS1E_00395 [Planctomycetota bacterium]
MADEQSQESLEPGATRRWRSRLAGFSLWLLAIILMAAAVVYQRTTGPTYPKWGSFSVGGETFDYELIRSQETTRAAVVLLPDPGPSVSGTLSWRRYPLKEPFTATPLRRDAMRVIAAAEAARRERLATELQGKLFAAMAKQPAAGKLEYYIVLDTSAGSLRIPQRDDENIVMRYKDPVPAGILIPHIVFVFLAVLTGMRAGLSALVQPGTVRRYAWVALTGMTIGGMIFGPIVQKYAFGTFWAGFPRGCDLTDNKMLIMWLAWIAAVSAIGLRARPREGPGRVVVILAAIVMMVVYLIPHSMSGSELDYTKLEQGVPAREAIGTGGK